LLGYKIFTQSDTYCPTNYYPRNIVILSSQGEDPYFRQPSRSNCHSAAYTTHNGVQHKVSTKNSTSILITNGHLLFVMGALILLKSSKCEVRQVTKDIVKSEVSSSDYEFLNTEK